MRTAKSIRRSVESGELKAANVSAAAALGDQAAVDACDQPLPLDTHYRTSIEQVRRLLSDQQCLEFAQNACERALIVWCEYSPEDQRPKTVYDSCCSWLNEEMKFDFRVLADLAAKASSELDFPELTEDVDPNRCRAMNAANAIEHFALAIDVSVEPDPPFTVAETVAWVARFCSSAACDETAERRTMNTELASLLLTPT